MLIFDTNNITIPAPPRGTSKKEGQKYDSDKPMMNLFPLSVAESISKVLTFGAQKYEAHGWKTVPKAVERYQAALLRHMSALQKGEEYDTDSGLPHVYHIGCNITFLIYFYNQDSTKFMEDIKA